jgi:hypothetical protein
VAEVRVGAVVHLQVVGGVAPPTAVLIAPEGVEAGGGGAPCVAADVGVVESLLHHRDVLFSLDIWDGWPAPVTSPGAVEGPC